MENKMFERICEEVDAAVFSGDPLHNDNDRKEFREYLARWERGAKEFDTEVQCCTNCSFVNSLDAKKCSECGEPLFHD